VQLSFVSGLLSSPPRVFECQSPRVRSADNIRSSPDDDIWESALATTTTGERLRDGVGSDWRRRFRADTFTNTCRSIFQNDRSARLYLEWRGGGRQPLVLWQVTGWNPDLYEFGKLTRGLAYSNFPEFIIEAHRTEREKS